MFNTKSAIFAAALTAFAASGIASAEAHYNARPHVHHGYGVGQINYRINNQRRRIRFGRFSGRLTRTEAYRVRFELSHIRGFRARYMRNGRLSFGERRHLRRLLNRNSRRISRYMNNSRRSYGSGRWRSYRGERVRSYRNERRQSFRQRRRLSRYNGF